MNHSEEDVTKFHKALHRLCGLPELTPTLNDQRAWHDFLLEMKPLEDTEGGIFVLADITAVVSEMARQKREGIASWSLKPSMILRDPEKFRDMVLQARSTLRVSKRIASLPPKSPTIQRLPNGTTRLTEEPEPNTESIAAGQAAFETFSNLRKQAGLSR